MLSDTWLSSLRSSLFIAALEAISAYDLACLYVSLLQVAKEAARPSEELSKLEVVREPDCSCSQRVCSPGYCLFPGLFSVAILTSFGCFVTVVINAKTA